MVNLEHKLTVDDLIVEYLIYKVKNGYEVYLVGEEFIDFLNFFEKRMVVEDVLDDKYKLLERFFERKNKYDWYYNPHMDMEYMNEIDDYVLFANYKLSIVDLSIITTYFMDNGLSMYDSYKGTTYKIRNIIGDYLKNKSKRVINEKKKISEDELLIGKYVVSQMVLEIWDSYIKKQIKDNKWPSQCNDINKYLFEMDLAKAIGVPSIKTDLINVYNDLSKRIGILYHDDENLKIESSSNVFLAKANYNLLINEYEQTMKIAFDRYKKSLNIDLSNFEFKIGHKLGNIYNHENDVNRSMIIDDKTKILVKTIDKKQN